MTLALNQGVIYENLREGPRFRPGKTNERNCIYKVYSSGLIKIANKRISLTSLENSVLLKRFSFSFQLSNQSVGDGIL